MSINQIVYETITCNGPDCKNTVTYETGRARETLTLPENAWTKTARLVQPLLQDPQNPNKLVFLYCSDACEVKGTALGVHNLPEPKRVISGPGVNAEQVAAAAAAAKRAEEATAALKTGNGPVVLG
jgi:hypothetical protein